MSEKHAAATASSTLDTGTISAQEAFTLYLIKSFVQSGSAREAETLLRESKLNEPARTLAKELIHPVGR